MHGSEHAFSILSFFRLWDPGRGLTGSLKLSIIAVAGGHMKV